MAIQRTATLSELEKLARADDLTGIANRRAFNDRLETSPRAPTQQGDAVGPGPDHLDHFKG